MHIWPKSIRGQLTFILISTLIVGHLVSFWIVAGERAEAVRSTARQYIIQRTLSVVRLIEATPLELHDNLARAVSSPLARYRIESLPITGDAPESDLELDIARALGEALGDLLPAGRAIGVHAVERSWRRRFHDDDDDESDRRRRRPPPVMLEVAIPIGTVHWLNVRIGDEGSSPAWALASLISLVVVAVAILVVVALSARRITKPLKALAETADRFGRGGPPEPLEATGPDETRRTIVAFNAMQSRISRYVADRTRMLAAMSHDLRTPITSLRLQAEFVDDEQTKTKIIEILAEMQAMAEESLAFAREDAAAEPIKKTDLTALLDSVAADAREMALDVDLQDSPKVVTSLRVQAIKRALRNLIDNACRYGKRASIKIDTQAAQKNTSGSVRITIDDDGPGIADDKLQSVFEPFFRLEQSRSRETGGAGLGLAIVRTIIQSHGGDVWLENRPQGGLRAVVKLPLD